jgi:hypothetical protein
VWENSTDEAVIRYRKSVDLSMTYLFNCMLMVGEKLPLLDFPGPRHEKNLFSGRGNATGFHDDNVDGTFLTPPRIREVGEGFWEEKGLWKITSEHEDLGAVPLNSSVSI